ncbi:MAG: hypothetical protein OXU23_11805 [Candidatus Poribacteria bacterium]|nr:hypothetical protein [Candidatus Poribacteria bacterium]
MFAFKNLAVIFFVLAILFSSIGYAEDWTQIAYSGIQGFADENQKNPAIGIIGFVNLELKHTHKKSWFNYYNRVGILGALEYHTDHSHLSGTIQFPFFSYWISKEHLLQISTGPVWSDAIVEYKETITLYDRYGSVEDIEVQSKYKNETTGGISFMILLNYIYPKDFYINSGSLFLRADYLENVGARGMIGLSFGRSILERFSD